jgi:hypothetical protein
MTPENLRDAARLAYDRELAKQNLKTAMTSRLTVTHHGGVFLVNTDLFVILQQSDLDQMVILDAYDTPVLVNRKELNSLARQRFQEVMNEWQHQYEQQVNVRSAKNL